MLQLITNGGTIIMRLNNLQKFNHGSQGINYNCNGLTSKQYNEIYLQACNKYNTVNQNYIRLSMFEDKIQGYIVCK